MNMSFIPEDDYSRYQAYLKEKAFRQEGEPSPKPKTETWFYKNRNIILTSIFSAIILGILGFVGTLCKTTIDEVKTLTVQTAVMQNDVNYMKQDIIDMKQDVKDIKNLLTVK